MKSSLFFATNNANKVTDLQPALDRFGLMALIPWEISVRVKLSKHTKL